MKNLPRLLIVSESTLSQNSRGANRTLANLFESYPTERLAVFAPQEQLKIEPTAASLKAYSFRSSYLPGIRNRIGKFINPILTAINLQLLDWLPTANRKNLEEFSPEVILICPITPIALVMGYKLTKYFNCPAITYFMDDWVASNNTWWLSGNVNHITRQLLAKSAGWISISEQLEKSLAQRYQIKPKKAAIVHNPVDLSGKELPDFEASSNNTFKVVYAGSIWQMHYDAIAVIAQAIWQLQNEGKNIELILHTANSFWNQYRENWQKWNVKNGGFIPYKELNYHLQQGDLLLVASSFLPEHSFMTRSSVQTKITDYMASGKPILSCGPNYSACNYFIKKWNCGLVCETNKVLEVKTILKEQILNRHSNQRYAEIAFDVLKTKFEKKIVSNNLYKFIDIIVENQAKLITYQDREICYEQNTIM